MAHACITNTRKRKWTDPQPFSDSESEDTQNAAALLNKGASVQGSEQASQPPRYDNNFSNFTGNDQPPQRRFSDDDLSRDADSDVQEDEYLTPIRGAAFDQRGDSKVECDDVYTEIDSSLFPVLDTHSRVSGQNGATSSQNENIGVETPRVRLPRRRSTQTASCVSDSYKCKVYVLAVFNTLLMLSSATFVYIMMTHSQQQIERNSTAEVIPESECLGFADEEGSDYCIDCSGLQEHTGSRFLDKYKIAGSAERCCFGPCQGMFALVSKVTQQHFGSPFIHMHGDGTLKLSADDQYGIRWRHKEKAEFGSVRDEVDVIVDVRGIYFIYADVKFFKESTSPFANVTDGIDVNYNVTKTFTNGTQQTIDEVSLACSYEDRNMRGHSLKTASLSYIEAGSRVGVRITGDNVHHLYQDNDHHPHRLGLIFVAHP